MNNKILAGVGVFVVLAGSGAYIVRHRQRTAVFPDGNTRTVESSGFDTPSRYPTRENNDANISIFVTPEDLSQKGSSWDFDVIMSNHMYDLGIYDLSKLATLTDDTGKTHRPISWSPDAKEGHHVGGKLTFNRLDPISKQVKLTIVGIGGAGGRVFQWSVQ